MANKYAHLRPHADDRGHYRADGLPKRPYPTQEKAEAIVVAALEQGKPQMQSYKCWCGGWHVGRPPIKR